EGRAHLGDLAISLDTASRQARRAGHSLRREIEMLLAHGLLHLMGYDHETDDGTMLRLQAKALAAARMPRPRRGPAATRAGRGRNGRRARPAARVRGGHGTKARRGAHDGPQPHRSTPPPPGDLPRPVDLPGPQPPPL